MTGRGDHRVRRRVPCNGDRRDGENAVLRSRCHAGLHGTDATPLTQHERQELARPSQDVEASELAPPAGIWLAAYLDVSRLEGILRGNGVGEAIPRAA